MSERVALGDVVDIRGGGTPSKANAAFWDGDIPWVSPKDMKRWEISDAEDKITAEAISGSATNLIPENSILVVNRSGILKHTLPVGITRRPVAINQDIKALICRPRVDPNYLAHVVKASEPVVLKWVRATTADNFSIDNLRTLEIPLPPLPKQRRIAAILDKADALRRNRQRAVDLLDSLTQSIFLEMFGDLTTSRVFPMGTVSDWVEDFETGKNLAPDPNEERADGYRVLKVSAVTSGQFLSSESKPLPRDYEPPNTHFVRQGDLLFSRANTAELIGATAIVEESYREIVLPDKLWRFVWRGANQPNPRFIHALFSSKSFRNELSKRATGTSGSMKNISKEKVLQIPIAKPSRQDQDAFVRRSTQIAKALNACTEQERLFSAQFASLQSRAFAGEL